MQDLLARLGWVGMPLVACSLLALGIVIERAVSLRRSRLFPPDLLGGMQQLVGSDDLEGALRLARTTPGALASMLVAAFEAHLLPPETLRDVVQESARHETPTMERHLGSLGTIASIAPMLGLLGTVSGIQMLPPGSFWQFEQT